MLDDPLVPQVLWIKGDPSDMETWEAFAEEQPGTTALGGAGLHAPAIQGQFLGLDSSECCGQPIAGQRDRQDRGGQGMVETHSLGQGTRWFGIPDLNHLSSRIPVRDKAPPGCAPHCQSCKVNVQT